jgi:hypothetical protein
MTPKYPLEVAAAEAARLAEMLDDGFEHSKLSWVDYCALMMVVAQHHGMRPAPMKQTEMN